MSMKKLVLPDCCILGLLINPHVANPRIQQCKDWAVDLRRKGTLVKIPAIANYGW